MSLSPELRKRAERWHRYQDFLFRWVFDEPRPNEFQEAKITFGKLIPHGPFNGMGHLGWFWEINDQEWWQSGLVDKVYEFKKLRG